MMRFGRKNWPGLLSITLAATAVFMYWAGTPWGFAAGSMGKLGAVSFDLFQLCTTSSLIVGIVAVVRARRGAGGLPTAVAGTAIGGTLTLLWVIWIGGLMLNPGALGD
jgi:hypothetical protein